MTTDPPDTDHLTPELMERAGRYADRLSINIELPTAESLTALAPEKNSAAIDRSMARMAVHIGESRAARKEQAAQAIVSMPQSRTTRRASAPLFAPGGQSTQMIVGADATDDRTILATSARLYGTHRLRRVYYSAFSPIPDAARALPLAAPPTVREHRLYQADWLMRFYGFAADEITAGGDGLLALDVDPKLAWALAHPERFPVDLNRAPRELLLRVPGLGVKAVDRLLQSRRVRRLRSDDLQRLRVPLDKVLPFVTAADHVPRRGVDAPSVAARLRPAATQGVLF